MNNSICNIKKPYQIYIFLALLFICCKKTANKHQSLHLNKSAEAIKKESHIAYTCDQITYHITQLPAGGYGYTILINDARIIDQPHIPGLSTTNGFSDTMDAAATALFVIDKIRKDQWPPSVNPRELDSLGVTR